MKTAANSQVLKSTKELKFLGGTAGNQGPRTFPRSQNPFYGPGSKRRMNDYMKLLNWQETFYGELTEGHPSRQVVRRLERKQKIRAQREVARVTLVNRRKKLKTIAA